MNYEPKHEEPESGIAQGLLGLLRVLGSPIAVGDAALKQPLLKPGVHVAQGADGSQTVVVVNTEGDRVSYNPKYHAAFGKRLLRLIELQRLCKEATETLALDDIRAASSRSSHIMDKARALIMGADLPSGEVAKAQFAFLRSGHSVRIVELEQVIATLADTLQDALLVVDQAVLDAARADRVDEVNKWLRELNEQLSARLTKAFAEVFFRTEVQLRMNRRVSEEGFDAEDYLDCLADIERAVLELMSEHHSYDKWAAGQLQLRAVSEEDPEPDTEPESTSD